MDLIALLRNAKTFEDIDCCWEEISVTIPDMAVMFGYDQNNQYHCYDLSKLHVRSNPTVCVYKIPRKQAISGGFLCQCKWVSDHHRVRPFLFTSLQTAAQITIQPSDYNQATQHYNSAVKIRLNLARIANSSTL